MAKTLWVTCVSFKRTKAGPWEEGVGIGHEPGAEDLKVIVDSNGKPLAKAPWDFKSWPYRGSFTTITEIQLPSSPSVPV